MPVSVWKTPLYDDNDAGKTKVADGKEAKDRTPQLLEQTRIAADARGRLGITRYQARLLMEAAKAGSTGELNTCSMEQLFRFSLKFDNDAKLWVELLNSWQALLDDAASAFNQFNASKGVIVQLFTAVREFGKKPISVNLRIQDLDVSVDLAALIEARYSESREWWVCV